MCFFPPLSLDSPDVAALSGSSSTGVIIRAGNIVLRRLPPTHPQHARCLRAATENVRPGFFSEDSPYDAVQVLDIYKVCPLPSTEQRTLCRNPYAPTV